MAHLVDAISDAVGLNCPESVAILHNKVHDLAPGDLLETIVTDPSIHRDIPKFCMFLGHELVEQQEETGTYLYRIRERADQAFRGPHHPTCFSTVSSWAGSTTSRRPTSDCRRGRPVAPRGACNGRKCRAAPGSCLSPWP